MCSDECITNPPLLQGRSRMLTGEPTLHTRTACMVAQAMTGAEFTIMPQAADGAGGGSSEGGGGQLWFIECQGAGVSASKFWEVP